MRTSLVPGCLSKSADIWQTGANRCGHLFTFGPNSRETEAVKDIILDTHRETHTLSRTQISSQSHSYIRSENPHTDTQTHTLTYSHQSHLDRPTKRNLHRQPHETETDTQHIHSTN